VNTILFSSLTFLLGLLLGNWLAINRDRRREFNEAVQPVRKWLLSEIDDPSAYRQKPNRIELDTFMSCLSWWRRGRFRVHLERQDRARQETTSPNAYNEVSYTNIPGIKTALRACLRYTERR